MVPLVCTEVVDVVEEAVEFKEVEELDLCALLRGPGANILPASSWLILVMLFWEALIEFHRVDGCD